MLKQHWRLVRSGLITADCLLAGAALGAAYVLRQALPADVRTGQTSPLPSYAWILLLAVIVQVLCFLSMGRYGSMRIKSERVILAELIRPAIVEVAVLSTAIFVFQQKYVSRLVVALFVILQYLFIALSRLAIRFVQRKVRRLGYNYRNLLVVGTSPLSSELIELIRANEVWGLRVVGMIRFPNEPAPKNAPAPILGDLRDIDKIVDQEVIDDVVLMGPFERISDLDEALRACEEVGVNIHIRADFLSRVISTMQLEDFHGQPFLTYAATPGSLLPLAIKRGMDIVIALAGLIGFSWLFALIAVAVRRSSPGPILFRQTRCGLNGRRFTMLKFRSMYADAEQRREEVMALNEMSGPVFKASNDPRITPVGRFLRRFSLDELPQLWNVLVGHMSLVGPRPPLPEEIEKYQRWQRRRLSMRPGLTCLWQVSGRNEIDFDEWMKLDLEYIDNWSLWLDVKILLKTIPAVLLGRGAR